jgi:NTE family protein
MWFGFLKGEAPVWRRLIDFWKENTAQSWVEHAFDETVIQTLRIINSGMLPAFQLSPSSPLVHSWLSLATFGSRQSFTDFAGLLCKFIDFDELAAWGPRTERPVLIVGTANVSTGKLAKFVSTKVIRGAHPGILRGADNIFPAVRIGEHAYWDGLFSDNPPVEELIRPRSIGPDRSNTILDRRNQMEGNISLFHQLGSFQVVRRLRTMIENELQSVPESRIPALRQELELLDRAVEKLYALPEDLARARISDSQGLGGASGQ